LFSRVLGFGLLVWLRPTYALSVALSSEVLVSEQLCPNISFNRTHRRRALSCALRFGADSHAGGRAG